MTPATLAAIEQYFLEHVTAAVKAKAPYVWGGKGDRIWTPKGVIRNPYPVEVFDCSGLITTALYRAGGPDLRFTHGAKDLRACCPPAALYDGLRLRFYPGHVALRVMSRLQTPAEIANPRAILIEAAGGGRHTLTPTFGGYVRRGPERRKAIAEGSLSAYLATL